MPRKDICEVSNLLSPEVLKSEIQSKRKRSWKIKLSSWSEDLPLVPTTNSSPHIPSFFISYPKSGTRDRCITQHFKVWWPPIYIPSIQTFFFPFGWHGEGEEVVCNTKFLWRVEKIKNYFHPNSMYKCTSKMRCTLSGLGNSTPHTKGGILVKISEYLHVGLPQLCDSRFHSSWLWIGLVVGCEGRREVKDDT